MAKCSVVLPLVLTPLGLWLFSPALPVNTASSTSTVDPVLCFSHAPVTSAEEVAMHIPGLRGVGPGTVLKHAVTDFIADDMATYAAALAYQVLFSLFPFILFFVTLLGFLEIPSFFDWLRQQAATLLPAQAMGQVNQVITQLRQPRGGLLSMGIIIALWSASAGVRATMNALNVAYDVTEGRPVWKRYPLSLLYTLGLAALLILATGLMAVGPQWMGWLAEQVGLGRFFVLLWTWLRWPVAILLLMLAVALIYYVAPDVEQEFRFLTPGAILAVVVLGGG